MHRLALTIVLAVFALPALVSARDLVGPPGGPAPKALLGNWQTTLTATDVRKEPQPDAARIWELTIMNGKYLTYAHALGFGPANSGRDTVPFAVKGHKLLLACLTEGTPSAGYATYSWSITTGALHFKLEKEPCPDKVLRDRIIVLTSRAWHRAR